MGSSSKLDAVLDELDSSDVGPGLRVEAQTIWERAFVGACAAGYDKAATTVARAEEVANLAVLAWARRWARE